MASYLESRPTDVEIIEAIRYHFPIGVQRAMLTNQLRTIKETLDLLKKVEVMEASEGFEKPHSQPQTHNPTPQGQVPDRYERYESSNSAPSETDSILTLQKLL
jgi:hypothetical protein